MKIVAIGGGEIGRPGFAVETTEIDQEIIKLTEKRFPRLLFIPTASSDAKGYVEVVQQHFGERLNCQVDTLHLINQQTSVEEIKEKIFTADIIYVGGGNTLKMMQVWQQYGVDQLLKEASQKNIVLSGLSAGAICWFVAGCSDSHKFDNPAASLTKVSGLGLISAMTCPHYDVEKDRKEVLKQMMKNEPGVAIALDNCAALEVIDNTYRIITSKPSANAYKVYWSEGQFYEEIIAKEEDFKPLSILLN